MKFYKHLYLSEKIIKKKYKVCFKLKHNIGQIQVYVIALASGSDQLEIYHCSLLKQKYFRKNVYVVGIAESYSEAVLLTQTIVEDIFQKTGTVDIKNYILHQ